MNLKAICIDDEPFAYENLVKMIEKLNPGILMEGSAQNVLAGLKLYHEVKPDIVFLNVKLGNQTGFDFLEAAGEISAQVIFTTGSGEYSVEPLQNVFDQIRNPKKPNKQETQIKVLSSQKTDAPTPSKLCINTSDGLEIIDLKRIVYLKALRSYVEIHLKDAKPIVCSKNLKFFEGQLVHKNSPFMRVHRSYLVNLASVIRFRREGGGVLDLYEGSEIPITSTLKQEVLDKLLV